MSDIRKLLESIDSLSEGYTFNKAEQLEWLLQQDFDVWEKIGWATTVYSDTPERRSQAIETMMSQDEYDPGNPMGGPR